MPQMPKQFNVPGIKPDENTRALIGQLDFFFRLIRADLEKLQGVSGTFTSADGKTITILNGIVTEITGP